jgi:hypothetical protein
VVVNRGRQNTTRPEPARWGYRPDPPGSRGNATSRLAERSNPSPPLFQRPRSAPHLRLLDLTVTGALTAGKADCCGVKSGDVELSAPERDGCKERSRLYLADG